MVAMKGMSPKSPPCRSRPTDRVPDQRLVRDMQRIEVIAAEQQKLSQAGLATDQMSYPSCNTYLIGTWLSHASHLAQPDSMVWRPMTEQQAA